MELGTPYILVVDDDPDVREILELVLSTLPVRIMYAHDGSEALIFIKILNPLLILLDLSMPHVDGRAVLRTLRSSTKTSDIPIIIFTAHHITDELLWELKLPVEQVICKGTTSMTDLRHRVIHLLRHHISVEE
jgi:CheY-like chemotaxis protein